MANAYTVKTCFSECEVAHVHHQIQIRHQYKTQTKSWKYRENKEYYCIVSMYSCKWCLFQISTPKATSRKNVLECYSIRWNLIFWTGFWQLTFLWRHLHDFLKKRAEFHNYMYKSCIVPHVGLINYWLSL